MKYDKKKWKQWDLAIVASLAGAAICVWLAGLVAVVVILWKLVALL